MIYNIDDNCIQYWNTTTRIGDFNRSGNPGTDTIVNFDCVGAIHNGTLREGTAASGISSIISYTGGNGGIYTG